MIDGYQILSAIKTSLDNNADLDAALGVKDDSSKVLIGSALPEAASYPLVLLPDINLTPIHMGQGARTGGTIQFDIHVYAATLAAGREDLEKLYHICTHIDSALSSVIDATTVKMYNIELQGSQAATVDLDVCRKILTYSANAMEKP